MAVNTDGRQEFPGLSIGLFEAETFWVEPLRSLKSRGLGGVKLVIFIRLIRAVLFEQSDDWQSQHRYRRAHFGPKARAAAQGLPGIIAVET